MAILGVESAIFGVDDLERCAKFWQDFGLKPVSSAHDEHVFEVASGSKVIVRRRNDPALLAAYAARPGIRRNHLGPWTVRNLLEALVADLSRDRRIQRDADGTVPHFLPDDGMPLSAFVCGTSRAVVSQPDPVNAPGNIQRLNQHRKWRQRALPENHQSRRFLRERLGVASLPSSSSTAWASGIPITHTWRGSFRVRADGTNEHHSICTTSSPRRCRWLPTSPDSMHMAFGLEDIDEPHARVSIRWTPRAGRIPSPEHGGRFVAPPHLLGHLLLPRQS